MLRPLGTLLDSYVKKLSVYLSFNSGLSVLEFYTYVFH